MTLGKDYFICKGPALFFLFFFATLAGAAIPEENVYKVDKRNYAVEPDLRRFTVSARDRVFLVKPTILSYTQLNPLNPKALYTLPPYPQNDALPRFGKWMNVMTYNGQPSYLLPPSLFKGRIALVPAHWISLTNSRGQYIIEPINYIFIVYENKQQAAVVVLNAVLAKAGFLGTFGKNHSVGYYAYIGECLLTQLATRAGAPLTYSNADYRFQNDHFRVFGAYHFKISGQAVALFAASISEESGYELNQKNANDQYHENHGHHFVSFSRARNNLAVALIQAGYATYYSSLGNVVNTLGESTEDHDGQVYITVIR